jgi:hypothetical protein
MPHQADLVSPSREHHEQKSCDVPLFSSIHSADDRHPPFLRSDDLHERDHHGREGHAKQDHTEWLVQEGIDWPEMCHQREGGGHATHWTWQSQPTHHDARLEP